MTKETYNKTIESAEYEFALLKGLEEDNLKYKTAITEVLEVLEGGGVPNTNWIKKHLQRTITNAVRYGHTK